MSSTSSPSNASVRLATLFVREDSGCYRLASPDEVLQRARYVMSHRIQRGATIGSPEAIKDFLRLNIGLLEHEVFAVVYLDSQHRILQVKELFRGTISQTSIYPREVLKEALRVNAGAAILAHNHPSGDPEPSMADRRLTQRLQETLAMIDVVVLDHLVVNDDVIVSFAERGLL